MGIQVASVSIGTKLNLGGFNQGLRSISSLQSPTVSVKTRIDATSLEQEKQRLEKLFARNLTVTVKADDRELIKLNQHIESKRTHVKDVNAWMQRNAIKVKTDQTDLHNLNKGIENNRSYVKDVNSWMQANPIRVKTQTEKIDESALKTQEKEIEENLKVSLKVNVKASVKDSEKEQIKFSIKDGVKDGFKDASKTIKEATSQKSGGVFGSVSGAVFAPFKQALSGAFSGIGLPIGEKIGQGILKSSEKRLNKDFEKLGSDLENYLTTKSHRLADAALRNVGLSAEKITEDVSSLIKTLDNAIEPEPIGKAFKKAEALLVETLENVFVFKDLDKVKATATRELKTVASKAKEGIQNEQLRPYTGAAIRTAAYPFKIRRSVEATKQVLEAEKMAESIQVQDIGEAKSLTLAIAGKNNVQGAGSAIIAPEIQALTGKQSHVVPVANPYTDSGLAGADYFVEEVLAKADKGFLGALNKYLTKRGVEVSKLSEKLTGEKSFAQFLYKQDKSGSLLGLEQMLYTGAVQGYNPDATSAAAHAIAYRKAYPDLPINIVGHSGGGEVAQGAAEMLSKGGIQANAVGLGTPTTGVVYAGNVGKEKVNYTSLMGDKDYINWQFFDDKGMTPKMREEYGSSPLPGMFPKSLAPIIDVPKSGALHSLPAYLGGIDAQQVMAERLQNAIPSTVTEEGLIKADVPKAYQSANPFKFIRDRELKAETPIKAIQSLTSEEISASELKRSLRDVEIVIEHFSSMKKGTGEAKQDAEEYIAFLGNVHSAIRETLAQGSVPSEELKTALDTGAKYHEPVASLQQELSPTLTKNIESERATKAQRTAQEAKAKAEAEALAQRNKTNLYRYPEAVKGAIGLAKNPSSSTRDLIDSKRDIQALIAGLKEDANQLTGVTQSQIDEYVNFLGTVKSSLDSVLNGEPLTQLDEVISQADSYFNNLADEVSSISAQKLNIPEQVLQMPMTQLKVPEAELIEVKQAQEVKKKELSASLPVEVITPPIETLPIKPPSTAQVTTPKQVEAIKKVETETKKAVDNIAKQASVTASKTLQQMAVAVDSASVTQLKDKVASIRDAIANAESLIPGDANIPRAYAETVAKLMPDLEAQIEAGLAQLTPQERLGSEIGNQLANLKSSLAKVDKKVKATLEKTNDQFKTQTTQLPPRQAIKGIGTEFEAYIKSTKILFKSDPEASKKAAQAILQSADEARASIDEMLATMGKQAGLDIKGAAKTARQKITRATKAASQIVGDSQDVGVDVSKGLAQGLTGSIAQVKKASALIAQATIDSAKDKLDIRSPSRVFDKIGKFVVQGFNQGLHSVRTAPDFVNNFIQEATKQSSNVPKPSRQLGRKGSNKVIAEAKTLETQINKLLIELDSKIASASGSELARLEVTKARAQEHLKSASVISQRQSVGVEEKDQLRDIRGELGLARTEANKPLSGDGFLSRLGIKLPDLVGNIKGVIKGFLGFQAVMWAQGILNDFSIASTKAAIAMESLQLRFKFISGSAKEAAENFAYVSASADRLGIDLQASAQGFVGLGGATRDTALEGQTQKIFSGVSSASSVYALDAEKQGRVFTAIQQMAGKGKVSAEELRQQLGESLPGAFQIAARAMGLTTQQLDKMMSEGKLLSEDFLPKFAQQLSAETASGVKGAANSSAASLNRFNNALFNTQAALGKTILPIRSFLLAFGTGALKFVTDNAELLLGVFRTLTVFAGIKLVSSFGGLATALLKIPMVAKAATSAMLVFQNVTGANQNKLKATQMVDGIGATLESIKANPAQAISGGINRGVGAVKDFGTAMLTNAKGGISALGASLGNLQKNGLANLGANFTGAATGVKAFGKAALVNGVAGFMSLAQGARALLSAIAPMLLMFAAIELGMRVFAGIKAAFEDASGESRDFADTATEGLKKYRDALAEARGETQKFQETKLVRDESLLDKMGIGALLPKEISADANWFDKLRFNTGKLVTGTVEAPANFLKTISGGALGATYEDKKLSDNLTATSDLREATNSTTSDALNLLGTKGQGARELGELKRYDDALRKIQTRRAALVALNPSDKAGLVAIDKEQNKILEGRERVSKPIGILQANMQSNVDVLKKEIEKYEKLSAEPGRNQKTYKNTLQGLKGDLTALEKIQEKFNRSVGESVDAFSLMQRNIQGVIDKLADADDQAKINTANQKANIYANAKSQGEIQFGLSGVDIQAQESQLKRLIDAQNQTRALLQNKDAQNVLTSYGVTENTGKAELKTLAEKTGDRVNDKFVIEQYAGLKERSIEIANINSGIAQAKQDLQQRARELNKQIDEYYRGVTRQFAESSIEFAKQSSQLKTTSYATELRTSIHGFQDNIVSQFVDSIIESITLLSEATDAQLDVDAAILQADNQFNDAIRQGEELRKQLPKYELGSSGNVPTIPIELDFAGIPTNSDLTKLNAEVGKAVDSTKDLTSATGDYEKYLGDAGNALGDNVNVTNALNSATNDVNSNVGDLTSGLDSANNALQSNVTSVSELDTGLQTTLSTNTDIESQINSNTEAVNNTKLAVDETNATLTQSVAKTGEAVNTSTQWWQKALEINNVILTAINPALGGVGVLITGLIDRTVDWFKTFANNVPIFNQIGQMFNSWGQQLQSVGQNIAGIVQGASQNVSGWAQGVGQNIANGISEGIDTVKGALGFGTGQGVGNVGKYKIVESVGRRIENVNSYKDLEKHHPSAGREKGRTYGNVNGEFEEIRNLRDGRTLVKKDFVLIDQKGSQAAAIPAMAAGFVKVLRDATNTVQIYADKEMKTMIGQSLHMRNIRVKTGDYVKYGQAIGTQSDAGSPGAIHAHIELEADRFTKYIQDLKDGVFEGVKGKETPHHLGDGHNHYGEEDAKKANQRLGSVTSSAQGMLASMGSNSGGLKSTAVMRRTGQLDDKGLEKLAVTVYNSTGQAIKTFTANSGKANTQNQFGGAGTTKEGSKAPLEYGRYSIGRAVAGDSPAVGKTFIPVNPQFKTQRNSLGFHFDADRPVGAGSAGCIVFATEAEFKAFKQAIEANGVNSLVFDGSKMGSGKPQTITGQQAIATTQQQPKAQAQPQRSGGVIWGKAAQFAPSNLSGLTSRGKQAMEALKNPHVRAFLDAVAVAELGDQAAAKGGYGYLFGDTRGKESFNPNALKAHPRRRVPFGKSASSATGRYQTMDFVWDEEHGRLGLKDMKPQSQEIMAVSRLMYRKILGEIMSGNVAGVLNKPGNFDASSEWASIQGNPYKQGTGGGKTSTFLANYQKALAKYSSGNYQEPANLTQTQQVAANSATAPVSASMPPIPHIQQMAIPQVWTPGSYSANSAAVANASPTSAASVTARGVSAIDKSVGIAEIQRARAIQAAQQKAENDAASKTATALRASTKGLLDLERSLRENGIKVTNLSNEVLDTNLSYAGALDTEQQRQQAQRKVDSQYAEFENNIIEQKRSIQSQVDTAKTVLGKGGLVPPEMKSKVSALLDNPAIAENLKEQLRTALSSGVLGDSGKALLEKALSEGQTQLGKLDTALEQVRKGRGESKASLDEKFAREERLKRQNAAQSLEGASIDTLETNLSKLKGQQSREPYNQALNQEVIALEKIVEARKAQLALDKEIADIEQKVLDKTITRKEADAEISERNKKKALQDEIIRDNALYAQQTTLRQQETRDREANLQLLKMESDADRSRLEQLKLISATNPLSPELANNAIGELEKRVALRDAEIQKAEALAAIDEQAFKGDRKPGEVPALKAKVEEDYLTKVANINKQNEQAAFASDIAQQRTILDIKQQQLDYQNQIVDATIKGISLGKQAGDPLALQFQQQVQQQQIDVEKEILGMKEVANKTGAAKEEVEALEQQIRDLNKIRLDNLGAEFEKAVSNRAFGIRQRLSSSNTELLDTQANFYSSRGMGFKAQELQKQSAIAQHEISFEVQRRELEEFIIAERVSAEEADKLRSNLEAVNEIKFDSIKDSFNTFKPVIDSVQGGLKNFFAGVIKGGQSIGDLFKGLMDSILSSVAELASNYIVEQLFGNLLGGGKNKGKGGMYAEEGKTDTLPTDILSSLWGGNGTESKVGLTPVTPMYVNVVNQPMGGLTGGVQGFLGGELGGFASSGGGFMDSLFGGSIFGGESRIDKTNPFPVDIQKSAPDAFSGISNAIGNLFGGGSGGGLGGIISSLVGGLGGGGGGGLGGILGMIMPIFGGLFAEGGVIGGSARSPKDDQLILAQKGEGILTHKGMDAIGGGAVLGAINDGRIQLPKFAQGGVVGGGYIPSKGEYGGEGSTNRVAGKANEPREVSVKVETTSINGVEYLTKAQGEELARKAAQEGASRGAQYVSDKLSNSVSYRNKHAIR